MIRILIIIVVMMLIAAPMLAIEHLTIPIISSAEAIPYRQVDERVAENFLITDGLPMSIEDEAGVYSTSGGGDTISLPVGVRQVSFLGWGQLISWSVDTFAESGLHLGDAMIMDSQGAVLSTVLLISNINIPVRQHTKAGWESSPPPDTWLHMTAYPGRPSGSLEPAYIWSMDIPDGARQVRFVPMRPNELGSYSRSEITIYGANAVVPEPSSLVTFLCGFSGLCGVIWRKRN